MPGGARRTVAGPTAERANDADARFSPRPFGAGSLIDANESASRCCGSDPCRAGNGPLAAPSAASPGGPAATVGDAEIGSSFERDGFTFFFPLTTGIVLPIVVSVIVWLVRK